MFTVSGILYGDYPLLADRFLRSVWSSLEGSRGEVSDFRLGLNEVCPATLSLVQWFAENVSKKYGLPVRLYRCDVNAFKYPLIRRMILDPATPPAEHVMWFDDDSYLTGQEGWWPRVAEAAESCAMLGKVYWVRLLGDQKAWIAKQPWYNPDAPPFLQYRGRDAVQFATGGWWAIRSAVLLKWDWPCLELKHCGGDSMLGELLRQQGYRLLGFEEGVRINANDAGDHSRAPRRGPPQGLLGKKLCETPDLSHQTFACDVTLYPPVDPLMRTL